MTNISDDIDQALNDFQDDPELQGLRDQLKGKENELKGHAEVEAGQKLQGEIDKLKGTIQRKIGQKKVQRANQK